MRNKKTFKQNHTRKLLENLISAQNDILDSDSFGQKFNNSILFDLDTIIENIQYLQQSILNNIQIIQKENKT